MTFPFLALPAEQRNQIYNFCAQRTVYVVPNDPKSPNAPGSFAALTKICRQIRAEYRPIQRREARIRIHWNHTQAFLDVFLSTEDDLAAPPRSICIMTKRNDFHAPPINILPLLRIKSAHPAFRCYFEYVPQPRTILQRILGLFFGCNSTRHSANIDQAGECTTLNEHFDGMLDRVFWMRRTIADSGLTSIMILRMHTQDLDRLLQCGPPCFDGSGRLLQPGPCDATGVMIIWHGNRTWFPYPVVLRGIEVEMAFSPFIRRRESV